MTDTLSTPWFSLTTQTKPIKDKGQHLCHDNPYAQSVAETLFSSDITVMGIVCRKGYGNKSISHQLEFHEIKILLQGELQIEKDGEIFDFKPGDLSYTTPYTNLRYIGKPNAISWFLYIMIEDTPSWEELKKNGSYVQVCDNADMIFMLLHRMIGAYQSRSVKSMNLALNESQMLLRLLRGLIHQNKEVRHQHKALKDLISEIQKKPAFDWTQSIMAKKAFVSPRTLSRLFKSEYGCSPLDMVSQQRFNHAIELLTNSELAIDDVARNCGYENITSFSRAFKKYVGTSPGQYRKDSLQDTSLKKVIS
jgi:AraC-like DNA-binding protein